MKTRLVFIRLMLVLTSLFVLSSAKATVYTVWGSYTADSMISSCHQFMQAQIGTSDNAYFDGVNADSPNTWKCNFHSPRDGSGTSASGDISNNQCLLTKGSSAFIQYFIPPNGSPVPSACVDGCTSTNDGGYSGGGFDVLATVEYVITEGQCSPNTVFAPLPPPLICPSGQHIITDSSGSQRMCAANPSPTCKASETLVNNQCVPNPNYCPAGSSSGTVNGVQTCVQGSGGGSSGGGSSGGGDSGGGSSGGGSSGGGSSGGGSSGGGSSGGGSSSGGSSGGGSSGGGSSGGGSSGGGSSGGGSSGGGSSGGGSSGGGDSGGGSGGGGSGGNGTCDPSKTTCAPKGSATTMSCITKTPPSCSGDALQCAMIIQQWKSTCDVYNAIHDKPDNYDQTVSDTLTSLKPDTTNENITGSQSSLESALSKATSYINLGHETSSISDMNIDVMGRTYLIPLSKANSLFMILAMFFHLATYMLCFKMIFTTAQKI
jgi:hypothetical protein